MTLPSITTEPGDGVLDPEFPTLRWELVDGEIWHVYAGLRCRSFRFIPTPARVAIWARLLGLIP